MRLNRKKTLSFSKEKVFYVVNDVASYKEFLPWCTGSEVLWDRPPELEGQIEISFGPLRHFFSTINTIEPDTSIKMRLASGPFKTLHGAWGFKEISLNTCEVSLELFFEFEEGLLSYAFSVFFQQVYSSLIDSFEDRLHSLFPKAS